MRVPALVVSLFVSAAACGGSAKPAPETPPPATSSMLDCAKVADHVATTVGPNATKAGIATTAINDMVSVRCKTDGWTDETRQCLFAMTTIAEGRACESSMTSEQRDAIKAHARTLRANANPTTDDDASNDWLRHVVDE